MVQSAGGLTNSTLAKMASYHRKTEAMVIIKAKSNPSSRDGLDLSTSEQFRLESICSCSPITALTIFENEGSHDRP